jgi:XRE family transcriptional regulator, regulator of sulfur utilization
MTSDAEREHTAARWLIDMDDTAFSDQQLTALRRWLRESDENCDTYLRLLRSMRRTLLLRRSDLPLMYGTRRMPASRTERRLSSGSPKREPKWAIPVEQVNKRLGEVVRELRQAKGWSQDMLATEARVTRGYLGRLEKGLPSPTVTVLVKISRALEVPASVLLKEMEGED